MLEEWRAVVGYEGLYEVSDLGGVRSLPVTPRPPGRPRGGPLSTAGLRSGYPSVTLCDAGGVRTNRTVHALVAEAFIGPRPDGWDIDHINSNRRDNRQVNLRYVTRAVNTQRSSHVKLDIDKVAMIRGRLADGAATKVVAGEFGVSQQAISHIATGRTWRVA